MYTCNVYSRRPQSINRGSSRATKCHISPSSRKPSRSSETHSRAARDSSDPEITVTVPAFRITWNHLNPHSLHACQTLQEAVRDGSHKPRKFSQNSEYLCSAEPGPLPHKQIRPGRQCRTTRTLAGDRRSRARQGALIPRKITSYPTKRQPPPDSPYGKQNPRSQTRKPLPERGRHQQIQNPVRPQIGKNPSLTPPRQLTATKSPTASPPHSAPPPNKHQITGRRRIRSVRPLAGPNPAR